ncbi:unnamed protein product [Tuber aestivum]|uniref:Uncharacterized protein n=1 Tax=Tuber aestivum TaxID=59557 RepID=A0A292PN57_9PEZI|nr:unnamed protein product [Tuber aestivum]
MMLVGSRPLGGLRFANQETKQPTQPTTQPIKEPTKGTKDRLWEWLSEVEARFGSLLKDVYECEVGLRTNLATLKAGMQLVKWEISAFTAAAITICGVILYFVDKWDKHWPASVVAILVEKNLVPAAPRLHTTTEALAPTPPAKTPADK